MLAEAMNHNGRMLDIFEASREGRRGRRRQSARRREIQGFQAKEEQQSHLTGNGLRVNTRRENDKAKLREEGEAEKEMMAGWERLEGRKAFIIAYSPQASQRARARKALAISRLRARLCD